MIDRHTDITQSGKLWIVLIAVFVVLYVLWQMSDSIAAGSFKFVLLVGAGFVALFVAGKIAADWRSGVAFFFVWLVFEDIVRKYLGNSMTIYFVKDVLLLVTYISLFASGNGRDTRFFRPPFRFELGLFFLLGFAQVFNPLSPSIFYGLLGLKLYFFYVPLMFVGYALLRNAEDLRRFLIISLAVSAVVSVVGILQAVIGIDFLNPSGGQDIDELSHAMRSTSEGFKVARPPSVFVSDGRFDAYLMLLFIIGLGTAGFLLLRSRRGRIVVFPALGLLALAGALCGGRTIFATAVASAVVLPMGMIWGTSKRTGESYRLIKAIRRTFVFVALAAGICITIFPDVMGGHLAYYKETILPGTHSQSFDRGWQYPVEQLQLALSNRNWWQGQGTGTASLGAQYVSRILQVPSSDMGVENGYGDLIEEMGILGPVLWLLWTISLFVAACRTMLKLRGTWGFPLGLSITWFTFILLFPLSWTGLVQYQNFVTNAYFWILIGFLFRLPGLVKEDAEEMQVGDAQAA